MKLKDFTRKTGREMAAYDFREEIVPFSPEETDELQRHIIYKAIGIAERDMKDEEKGMTPDDSWLAYREARDIYNAHREGLVPDGDADSCPLVLEILRELAGRQSGYPLLPELKGDVMNSIQTTLNLALELTSQRDMVKRYVADPTSLTDKLEVFGPDARRFLKAAYVYWTRSINSLALSGMVTLILAHAVVLFNASFSLVVYAFTLSTSTKKRSPCVVLLA